MNTELEAGKAAYIKAQKQRNLYIGLGLGLFVVLVFFVSMTRMAQNTRHEAQKAQESRASAAVSH